MSDLTADTKAPLAEDGRLFHHRGQLVELFLIAVVLPGVISLVNATVLREFIKQAWYGAPILLIYATFVVQVAVLSWLVGSRLEQGVLKWAVFLWALVLTDLQVFTITALEAGFTGPARCLAFAFMSGQVGLLTVWGLLSRTFWALRLPVAAVGLSVVISFAAQFGGASELWFAILCWQSLGTAVLCGVLWTFGFRIRQETPGRTDSRRLQFSVRHLFAWTTTVACVVGIVRLLDLTSFLLLGNELMLACIGLGGCFATISMMAVWAALGAESFPIRLAGLVLSTPLIALAIGAVGLARRSQWTIDALFLGQSYDPKLWLTWTSLAAFFLASLLIVFRASGFRLRRAA